ncbi:MAG: hypothetical protein IKZ65_02085, partial [Lachnospiraceae bacterium]|nr:hypothetical protein [Lachnospiraceae bacterium]
MALSRQDIAIPVKKDTFILQYGEKDFEEAVKLAMRLRDKGLKVKLLSDRFDYKDYLSDSSVTYVLKTGKELSALNADTGKEEKIKEEDIPKLI